MDELIRKQDVLELPRNKERNFRGEVVEETIDVELIKALPPVQPELYKDDVSRQAVKHLDLFTKVYCRDESVTNDLVFRCKQCDFEMPDGKCLVKTMARKLCPNYKNFGCMGDL